MSQIKTTRRQLLISAGAGLAATGVLAARAAAQDGGVTSSTLAAAGDALGVDLTHAEREQLLRGFDDQLEVIRALGSHYSY